MRLPSIILVSMLINASLAMPLLVMGSEAGKTPTTTPLAAAAAPATSQSAVMLNRIEIQVGNEIITTWEIEEPLLQLQEHLRLKYSGTELAEKMRQARATHIQRLIESKLLLLEAREQGIEIQDKLIEEQTRKEIEALRSQFPDEAAFEKQLAAEHLTPQSLEEERKQLARENLMRQRLLQSKLSEFKTGTDISDEQLKAYYEKHPEEFKQPVRARISQIFVNRPDVSLGGDLFRQQDQTARAKIQKAWEEIKAGNDFSAVARKYSEHQASAQRGGEVGWIESGDVGLPELEKAVFNQLSVGEVSKVLDTARGYFIVKLEEREAGGMAPWEEVRGRIRQRLMAEGSEQRYQAWIATLKEKYKIIYTHQPE